MSIKIIRADCEMRIARVGYDCKNCFFYHVCERRVAQIREMWAENKIRAERSKLTLQELLEKVGRG